ncbi:MAG: DNA repair protein RecO [Sphingomonadaceae bacterium]|uniref:DNA repair protein RecO n=1 Tax=Thermaurantiacus sp. TaxID=2820283 RepID=UPI00298F2811|nr:DNA repair protein RecO [Thermaurantiacus sp.]MCS6987704.1 DNA repair protein RecO [Sphingomonadaceae bacterium]MDW8415077.1 DNA repair protein RecO [Thermaurantiacus sp.]
MDHAGTAIVLTSRPHGEHHAIVRFLDLQAGLLAGFVHGARSRRRRADLVPGGRVRLALSRRPGADLPVARIEAEASRALLAFDPSVGPIVAYLLECPARLLAEGDPCPELAGALDGLLEAMLRGDAGWPRDFVRFEARLLAELGVGLDLAACALTGSHDRLEFVSPRSGRAVSGPAAQGQPWAHRLLRLPPFLRDPTSAEGDLVDGLRLTGHFLARHAWPLAPRLGPLRARAVARLERHPAGAVR